MSDIIQVAPAHTDLAAEAARVNALSNNLKAKGGKGFAHEAPGGGSVEYYTPDWVMEGIGTHFHMDIASPKIPPFWMLKWIDRFVDEEEDGLKVLMPNWWCNTCKVFRDPVELTHEEVSNLQGRTTINLGVLSQAPSLSGSPTVQLQGLRSEEVAGNSSTATERPYPGSEDAGAEETPRTKSEGQSTETLALGNSQSQEAPTGSGASMGLVSGPMGGVQESLAEPLCLLPDTQLQLNAGSLCSVEQPTMSRDSAEQHGSSVPVVQHSEARPLSIQVVQRGPNCPCCGVLLTARKGKVWTNPPYGNLTGLFFKRMAKHNNGMGLVFCRPGSDWFQDYVLGAASAVFYMRQRIRFWGPDGTPVKPIDKKTGKPKASSPGADSVIIAWGDECADILIEVEQTGRLKGKVVDHRGGRWW